MTSATLLHQALNIHVYNINSDQYYNPGFTIVGNGTSPGINGLDIYVIFSGVQKMTSLSTLYSRYGLRTLHYMRHTTPR